MLWRSLLKACLWLVVAVAALVASVAGHLNHPVTRRIARDVLTDFVNGEIRGTLKIDEITRLTPRRVAARGVTLLDPAGRQVIAGETVSVVPDLRAALRGVLRFKSARLDHTALRLLRGDDENEPSFLDTFEVRVPSPDSGPGLHVIVDDIRIHDLDITGQLIDLRKLHLEEVDAHGRLEIWEFVQVRLYAGKAKLTSPFPFTASIPAFNGNIDTDPRKGIEVFAKAWRADQSLNASFTYRLPKGAGEQNPRHLGLSVDAKVLDVQTLVDVGFDWVDLFHGRLGGTFEMRGPPSDLTLSAALETEGGHVDLNGRIEQAPEDRIHIGVRTDGAELGKILDGAPKIKVAGSLDIDITEEHETQTTRVAVDLRPFLFSRIAVPALKLDGILEDEGYRIQRVQAAVGGGKLRGQGFVNFDSSFDIAIAGTIPQIGRDPNVRRFTPHARASLKIDLKAKNDVKRERFGASGRLEFDNLSLDPLQATRLTVSGSARGRIDRPNLELHVVGQNVRFQDYPLGETDLRVQGGPRDYTAQGRFRAEGQRRIEFDAQVTAGSERWELDAHDIELAAGDQAWRGALRSVVWQPDQELEIGELVLASGPQRLDGTAHFRAGGPDELFAELQGFDLSALKAVLGDRMPDVRGRADARVLMRGTVLRPDLVVEGALYDGAFRELKDITAVYAFSYKEGELIVDGQAELGTRGSLSLGGTGILDANEPAPAEALKGGVYELAWEAADLDLALLRDVLAEAAPEVAGKINGELKLSGPLQAPNFDGHLKSPDIEFPGWPMLTGEVNVLYDNGVLNLRLVGGDERGPLVEAEGGLLIDVFHLVSDPEQTLEVLEASPWRVSFRAEPRQLGEWPGPIRRSFPKGLYPARAGFNATLAGGSLPARGDAHAVIAWPEDGAELGCGAGARPRLIVDGQLKDGTTNVVARAFVAKRKALEVELSAPTDLDRWIADPRHIAPPPMTLKATTKDLPLELVPYICRYASGPINLALAATDLLTDKATGSLEIGSRQMQAKQAPRAKSKLTATLDPEGIELGADLSWSSSARAQMRTRIPLRWKGGWLPWLDLTKKAELHAWAKKAPLGHLLSFVPGLGAARGELTGRIDARGDLLEANVVGEVQLRDGGFKIVGLGQEVHDLETTIIIRGDEARFSRLQAKSGDGKLTGSGELKLKGVIPTRAAFHIGLEKFPVKREASLIATMSGKAELSSEFGTKGTRTKIALTDFSVGLPTKQLGALQDIDTNPDIIVLGEQEEEEPSPTGSYALRFDIDAQQPFWVRRNDLEAQIVAEITATYLDPELRLRGYIDTRRGTFDVLGRRFELRQATLDFRDEPEINPTLNVLAVHRLDDASRSRVQVRVTGHLDNPHMTFTSPDIEGDESKIIAVLVSGQRDDPSRGVVTPTEREAERGTAAAQLRYGTRATNIVPKPLRSVVQSVYVEGFFSTQTATGGTNTVSTGRGTGFSVELGFPRGIVGTGTYWVPNNWSLDTTWEP